MARFADSDTESTDSESTESESTESRTGPAAATPARLTVPLLPLPSGVVFPEMVVTVALETDDARRAAEAAADDLLLLIPRVDDRFADVGALATIEHRGTLPNDTPALTVRVTQRARLGAGILGTDQALWVEVEPIEEPISEAARQRSEEYRTIVTRLVELLGGRRSGLSVPDTDHPGVLADTVAYWPELSLERRIQLLETIDLEARLDLAIAWATEALDEVEVGSRIRDEVNESLAGDQREVILRRQLAAIRKELGEGDTDVVGEYRARLDELTSSSAITEAVADEIRTEIDRLERTGEQGQEASYIRTWLDSVFELPFGERTEDNLDLVSARSVLDQDHTGLDDVKDRVIEHLAVRKLRAQRGIAEQGRGSRAILALVGPPGVGKTSLGESVARSLDRSFVRMALGGIRDEAEIRGHRRTYVGARPGRLARALVEAGSMNPVILLDEIDKIGNDWRGDPSAALLEVLDPAQNHSFRDHYLEFELDLSDVIFIATANRLDTIPGPLLDRVELIQLDGYTDDEKATIAHDHILPRLRERAGLRDDEVALADGVIEQVASEWTNEAGVRSLERQLDKLLRKAATTIATDPDAAPVTVDTDDLRELLGKPIEREPIADRVSAPGNATGLAVTGAGGDVLFVETTAMDGEPGLVLTGQLGDVMKESGEIARSYLRSHADTLGIDTPDRRLHVHFPAGAVPKDGPSAGITMTTALVSLLTGRAVRPEVAMTGEVTLQGRVLPIGGVKQKVLAAHRAGITEIILPARNGDDLDDVPESVRDALTIHLVDDVAEVLDIALAA